MTRDERALLEEKYGGEHSAAYEDDRERLASGEPLAYVIGWQPFLGLKIYLDSIPLIPRPETEWWTEQLISNVGTSDVPTLRILDLCAGSGAIGCAAIKYLPNAQVYFGELAPEHKATIRKNILENDLDGSRADIRIGDLFEPFLGMQFDFIAANPPYVPVGRELPASVAKYEPAMALRAGENGLAVISRIAEGLPRHLAPGGQAWIECDSAHAVVACALFTEQGFSAEIRSDQYDQPRILFIKK